MTTWDYRFAVLQAENAELRRLIKDVAIPIIKRYRNETPLGHQPHMIAHVAEEAIETLQEAVK